MHCHSLCVETFGVFAKAFVVILAGGGEEGSEIFL
jgi:hypothetical protein